MNNATMIPAAALTGATRSLPIRPVLRTVVAAGVFAGAAAAAGTVLVTELFGVSLGTASLD